MINISRMYQNFFNNIFKCKEQPKEIQIADIITCKDGVKFKIIDIKGISYSYGFKRIELILLTDKKRKIPTYTISEESLEQFIIFRYGCRDESGCIRYSCKNMDNNSSIETGKLPFDYMRYYELDIIIKIFKERCNFPRQLYEAMENMTFNSFDMIYKDLVFNLKGK